MDLKIEVEKYNPNWINQFYDLKNQLSMILESLNPIIEHIGSTSIQFLSAKTIIDIAVGIKSISELDLVIKPMIKTQFIYYEVYNEVMPERRLFVGIKDKKDGKALHDHIQKLVTQNQSDNNQIAVDSPKQNVGAPTAYIGM